jgi:putative MATE family efflux protein
MPVPVNQMEPDCVTPQPDDAMTDQRTVRPKMKDLTQGSIVSHISTMAPQIFAGMIMIMLCQLVDLYFVSNLGDAAVAGVAAAGNTGFLVNAFTQVLGVGTTALISHAVGRKDPADANLVFNQSLGLSALCGGVALVAGFVLARDYMRSVAGDDAVIEAGTTYLLWVMPALALQFAMLVMASALRGTGIVRPTTIVQAVTVLVNIALAPVLVTGWGTGRALGVAGAGLATSVSVVIGVVMMAIYFHRWEHYVAIDRKLWRPQLAQWKRISNIGLPAGGEFAILFANMAVIYYALAHFGAAAQAGFGIGSRLLGVIHMPVLSMAFAAGAIAGQNFGAGNSARVRQTFRTALLLATALMVGFMALAQWSPELLLAGFSTDPETIAIGALFLRMISLNLVAQGLIFVCSSMFQGLGNTRPALLSSGARSITYALPLLWLSATPGFRIEQIWYLSIVTTWVQAVFSLWLLRLEFRKRLIPVLL